MKKILIIIFGLCCIAFWSTAEVRYTVKKVDVPYDSEKSGLGSFSQKINNNSVIIGGYEIVITNDYGDIIGMSRTFVSTNGGLAAILKIPNEIGGYPIDINDSDEVLIIAGGERSYLYIAGDGFKLIGDTNFTTQMLDINNLGDIVGYRDMPDERERPVIKKRDRPIEELEIVDVFGGEEGSADLINDSGVMVLYRNYHQYYYDNTNILDLGIGGINDINENNVLVGFDYIYGYPHYESIATIWSNGNKMVIGYPNYYTEALAINNYGVVIGSAYNYGVVTGDAYQNIPLIWMNEKEGFINLNSFISDKYVLIDARDINDKGQIVGAIDNSSSFNTSKNATQEQPSRQVAVVLDPIPPKLDIKYESKNVVVSWSPNWPGLFLEQADSLGMTNWTAVSQSGTNVIVLPKTDKQQFFRLNIQAGRGLFWGP